MKTSIIALGILLVGALSACAVTRQAAIAPLASPVEIQQQPAGSGLPTVVIINDLGCATTLDVEIASTPQQLQTGLMKRTSLPEMQGMLFDFSSYGDTVSIPFYMKDTLIRLSIAFISADGVIVDIQDMEPLTETLHHPARPYKYSLEVNQGWFQRYGIKVGDKVELQR